MFIFFEIFQAPADTTTSGALGRRVEMRILKTYLYI